MIELSLIAARPRSRSRHRLAVGAGECQPRPANGPARRRLQGARCAGHGNIGYTVRRFWRTLVSTRVERAAVSIDPKTITVFLDPSASGERRAAKAAALA